MIKFAISFEGDYDSAWRVCCDGYVTADSGTGVVHQAPYFGADDYRVGIENGIITKDGLTACPVDNTGCFTAKVSDFKGKHVKDADKEIIANLKSRERLVKHSQIKHRLGSDKTKKIAPFKVLQFF